MTLTRHDDGSVTIQTGAHRTLGNDGITLCIADGKVVAWKLAQGGAWTTADLRKVRALYEEAKGALAGDGQANIGGPEEVEVQ